MSIFIDEGEQSATTLKSWYSQLSCLFTGENCRGRLTVCFHSCLWIPDSDKTPLPTINTRPAPSHHLARPLLYIGAACPKSQSVEPSLARFLWEWKNSRMITLSTSTFPCCKLPSFPLCLFVKMTTTIVNRHRGYPTPWDYLLHPSPSTHRARNRCLRTGKRVMLCQGMHSSGCKHCRNILSALTFWQNQSDIKKVPHQPAWRAHHLQRSELFTQRPAHTNICIS